MLTQEIKSKINWLWDRFWAGGLANPITAIEQISYLLFIHRLEHVDNGKLIKDERLKWSYFSKEISDPNELLIHFQKNVFPFIKSLKDEHEPFTLLMQDATFEIDKPTLLKEAIEVIDAIYLEIDRQQSEGQHFQDTQGDVYEYLLNSTKQAGKNGQFRTPRHIIQLMCELLNPRVDDKICDVTCGTSGFLVGAYQHILSNFSSKKHIKEDENGFNRGVTGDKLSSSQLKVLKSNSFFGFDNDKTMVRIGLMNLIMHGITEPKIERVDTLSKKYDDLENLKINPPNGDLKSKNRIKKTSDEQYTIILANPPFTGRVDKEGLSDKLKRTGTLKSEILFLDRIVHMLKPGGKAAVIVPEGVLFGQSNSSKLIREILVKDCTLDAIISLPIGVFYPYTGVKTSIIVFTKKQLNCEVLNTQKVWFYHLESDGYSLDSNRKRLNDYPLADLVKKWHSRSNSKAEDRTQKSFYVPINEIVENNFNLSINEYKEIVYTEQSYEPSKELIAKLLEMEENILKQLNVLNKIH